MAEHVDESLTGTDEQRYDRGVAKIRQRRLEALGRIDEESSGVQINKTWHRFSDENAREHYLNQDYRAGLAFSGGGIRSATLALGLSEALASRGRLYAFDMLSTVSGGGYFGSFLRALHLPRGEELSVVTDRPALAEATMTSLPDQQYFRGQPGPSAFVAPDKSIKNPLWWLRENGRYLAPGGMSDYGFALAYIVRNWLSLVLFILGVALIACSLMQLTLIFFVHAALGWDRQVLQWLAQRQLHSPLFLVLAAFGWVVTGVAGSYWITTPLSFSRTLENEPKARGWWKVVLAVGFLIVLLAGIFLSDNLGVLAHNTPSRVWTCGLMIAIIAALLASGFTTLANPSNSHVDFRREQTRLLAKCCMVLIALTAATAVDWAALSMLQYFDSAASDAGIFRTGVVSGAIASVLSFFIAKLPDWFGDKKTGIGKFLIAHARQFALIASILIIAAIALIADVLAIKLLWGGPAWLAASPVDWVLFGVVFGLVAFTVGMFGSSLNFANLLALTPFYGSRLTRAFIGGSNVCRLDSDQRSEVTQGLKDDDVPLRTYLEADTAAPLHFINVTRNRTVGGTTPHDRIDLANDDPLVAESADDPRGRLASYESHLTLHDRHGDRMVFGPFGMRVGAKFYGWDDMNDPPSLGLLCAISGAAVGAGMGRLTSLGTSMAFTLANIRLGYWWKEQSSKGGEVEGGRFSGLFPGLSCLAKELLGRFSTHSHWFLSDGGHSENTGVLTLIERGCRFILACDNGQDENFVFSDLEILIRAARTDIGMEVSVLDHTKFPPSLNPLKSYFFNGSDGDWRENLRKKDRSAFALLLKASDIPRRVNGVWKRRRGGDAYIVWLKPIHFSGLPADIATYAELHPDFPQQSTGNQFFDEAQWESYRRLGFEMGRRLFKLKDPFDPFLPVLYPRPSAVTKALGVESGR